MSSKLMSKLLVLHNKPSATQTVAFIGPRLFRMLRGFLPMSQKAEVLSECAVTFLNVRLRYYIIEAAASFMVGCWQCPT
jgi:hypothetical protein